MLILHHLGFSQSERITWLLEELQLDYKLVKHVRAPAMAPESLKNVPGNRTGKSPFLEDTDAGITISESGAITDYILAKYGNGRLALGPNHKSFAEYLEWKDFANSTLQPACESSSTLFIARADSHTVLVSMFVELESGKKPDSSSFSQQRLLATLQVLDDRLKESKWLAGDEFTAADTMSLYPVTTQRYFGPQVDLDDFPNLLRWMKDCSERPAYQKALEKGDADMKPLLGAAAPAKSVLAGGWPDATK